MLRRRVGVFSLFDKMRQDRLASGRVGAGSKNHTTVGSAEGTV